MVMSKNNRRNKNKNKNNQVSGNGNPRSNRLQTVAQYPTRFTGGIGGSPFRSLMYNPTNPGRAVMRGAIEVFNGPSAYRLSYKSFNDWCGPARSLLVPFQFFRVTDVVVKPMIAGGTSSAHTMAFNVSNNNFVDITAVSVLDDDYAAVVNAAIAPVLRPPQIYWKGGSRNWYSAQDPTIGTPPIPDSPPPQELIAGSVSVFGAGGALPSTIIGWMVIEFVLEFHTLV